MTHCNFISFYLNPHNEAAILDLVSGLRTRKSMGRCSGAVVAATLKEGRMVARCNYVSVSFPTVLFCSP